MKKVFNLKDIKSIAHEILSSVKGLVNNKAMIMSFSGNLGAGKTTLTKEIASLLGVENTVVSPTFVIMKNYKTKDNKFKNLIHIDAYRLDNEDDILVLGWDEISKNKDNLIIIEWPEKIAKHLNNPINSIKLDHIDETTRSIKFDIIK